jgi:hypothetical protein
MLKNTRLSDDEFRALRSIARDPWASGAGFQWKHNRRWLDVADDGWSRRVGSEGAYSCRPRLVERGQAARNLLLARGLVKEEEVHCCNGGCGRTAWMLTTLTERGQALVFALAQRAKQGI